MRARSSIVLRAGSVALVALLAMPAISTAAPGDRDSTFGSDGVVTTGFGYADNATASQDLAGAVVVDGNGRVVVGGTSSSAVGQGLAVARYATDGSLDSTFAHNGRFVTQPGPNVGGGGSDGFGLALDGSGRILAFTNNQEAIFGTRLHPDGTLDTSFGTNGFAAVPVGQHSWTEDIALDAAGRIVIVGGLYDEGTARILTIVVRLTANGTLDSTFAAGGVATLDLGGQQVVGKAIGINGAGIYIAGGANDNFFIARYTGAGDLDPAFGAGGVTVTDLGGIQEEAFGLAIDGSGRIVIGGTTLDPTADLALARYDASGNLDPTFSGDGMVITDAGPSPGYAEGVRDLAIDGSGRIVGSGWTHPADSFDTIAFRYLANGTLDTSFAGDGLAELGTATDDRAEGVAVDGSDVIIAGWEQGPTVDFDVIRLDGAGLPDTAWNGSGKVLTDMGPGHSRNETLYSVAELPDGRLFAGGGSAWDISNSDVAVALYNADGSLDTSFSGDGRELVDLGDWDEAYGVALQPGVGLLAAGYVDGELFVVRFGFNGALDPAFGTGGIVRLTLGSFAYAWAVAVDSSGRILLAGEGNGTPLVIRLLANGGLDPSFGSGGQATLSGSGYGASISFDSANRIVVAISDSYDMQVERLTPAGLPDSTFSGDGFAILSGPDNDTANGAVVDVSDRVLVAGIRNSAQSLFWRLDASGAPDPTFDGDGMVVVPNLGSSDRAFGVDLQADGSIAFVGWHEVGITTDLLIGRLSAGGALDTTFDGDGRVVLDLGANDQGWTVLVDASGRIVVGGNGGPNLDFVLARYQTSTQDTASGSATPGAGGSASTGTDPTPADPVETIVTVPAGTAGGAISITETGSPTVPPPTGYSGLGLEVQISAPSGSAANPLQLTFFFDKDAAAAAGVDELTIQLLRNGVPLTNCTATAPIVPDPCIVERARTTDNDIRIRALTSAASAWSLAARAPFAFTGFLQPVDNQPVQNTIKAGAAVPVKFKLGGNKGLDVFAATYPRSVTVTCGTAAPQDAIELTSTAGSSSLSYDAASDTYSYVWKTDKAWVSTCRQLVLRFADGSYQRATFKFLK